MHPADVYVGDGKIHQRLLFTHLLWGVNNSFLSHGQQWDLQCRKFIFSHRVVDPVREVQLMCLRIELCRPTMTPLNSHPSVGSWHAISGRQVDTTSWYGLYLLNGYIRASSRTDLSSPAIIFSALQTALASLVLKSTLTFCLHLFYEFSTLSTCSCWRLFSTVSSEVSCITLQ